MTLSPTLACIPLLQFFFVKTPNNDQNETQPQNWVGFDTLITLHQPSPPQPQLPYITCQAIILEVRHCVGDLTLQPNKILNLLNYDFL